MKKFIFTIFLFLVFICNVQAFSIDMDKVSVTSRSDEIINTLDKKYKIDSSSLDNRIDNDQNAVNFAKKMIEITFNINSEEKIKKQLINYMYVSEDDGFETLSGIIYLDSYLDIIKQNNILLGDIVDIKTVSFNNNDVMVFIYINNAIVNGKKTNIVLSYWLKEDENNKYSILYPWVDLYDVLNQYFIDISKNEEAGNIIGDSYNKLSLDGNSNIVSKEELKEVYDTNVDSVVQITAMNDNDNIYGSGFYLRKGIVVTSWSLFLKFLTEGNYIYINDAQGNIYDVLGVVAADTKSDVVLLKIDMEVGKAVTLSSTKDVFFSNKLFTINSKYNSGFSINYGSNISVKNGKLINLFPLSSSDVGSALFNEYNEVVGFNVGDKLYSELSYANSTDYLLKLQNKLLDTKYSSITYTDIDKFKENYYIEFSKEKQSKKIEKDIWDKYKELGNLEKNITMNLIKSSSKDGILSLRYSNDTNGMLDSIYLASAFTNELINQGYKLTFYNNQKYIYKNNKYQIILKENFNYLIILIMEI